MSESLGDLVSADVVERSYRVIEDDRGLRLVEHRLGKEARESQRCLLSFAEDTSCGGSLCGAEESGALAQLPCADAGVAVVLVPEIPGARASGATRWLSPAKALVQLSARHKRNDHLWFALFHELAHVLFHGKKEVFVENKLGLDGGRNEEEQEANDFAARTLIPTEASERLLRVHTYQDVKALAAELGIHPGIVAGRIQHDRQQYNFGVGQLFTSLAVSEAQEEAD